MKREFSSNKQSSTYQVNSRKGHSSPENDWQDDELPEHPLSDNTRSWDEQPPIQLDRGIKHTAIPSMYEDKHGIPVMYDATIQVQRRHDSHDDISMLWHELLSPLTVIKGYTSTLLQFSDAITEKEKEQYIQRIDSASNRVIRLLENLRDITKLEDNNAITTQPISLLELVSIIVSEVQSQTMKHIIKIRRPSRLPLVHGDPEKIEQVLNNLLVNAIKYSPQGGDIETEIQVIRNEQELSKMFGNAPTMRLPCLVVSIADNGIGIPESELNRIFDRFYRVKNKLTRSISGAGLGLYICKIIVEAHGGCIWTRNKIQRGSTFSFSLPIR